MKQFMKAIGAALLAGALAAGSITAMAADDQSQALKVEGKRSQTIDASLTGSVTISYTDAEGTDPVSGAEFTFYKIGELKQSVSDGSGKVRNSTESTDAEAAGTSSDKEAASGTSSASSGTSGTSSSPVGTQQGSAVVAGAFTPLIDGVTVDSSIKPAEIAETVQKAYSSGNVSGGKTYTAKTDAKGNAEVTQMELGAYLAVETKAAEGYYESIPCVFTVPQMLYQDDGLTQYWSYDVALFPKSLPAGNLKIVKKLSGNGTEKDREFHFKITFDTSSAKSTAKEYSQSIANGIIPKGYHTADSGSADKKTDSSSLSASESAAGSSAAKTESADSAVSTNTAAGSVSADDYGRTYDRASDTYTYEKSDGSTGTMKSGDALSLKGGESLTIRNIPAGTSYTVVEQEANNDGYVTSVKNEKNTISHKTLQTVTFINKRTTTTTKTNTPTTESGTTSGGSSSNRSALLKNRPKTGDATSFIAGGVAVLTAVLLIAVLKKQKK